MCIILRPKKMQISINIVIALMRPHVSVLYHSHISTHHYQQGTSADNGPAVQCLQTQPQHHKTIQQTAYHITAV
jgi:hypothetical protein